MIELTDQNFNKTIQNTNGPVLVDFWAHWCSPCLVLGPILEKLVNEYREKLILAKVSLDTAPLAAQKYGIEQIPTVILFKEGKPISGFVGVKPEPQIREWLEENLKNETERIEELIKEVEEDKSSSPSSLSLRESSVYEEYAKKNGFKLNPNREVVERIIKGLLENEKKYGQKYCPCRRISGNSEEDKSKICPCAWHREEIEKNGRCLCGLFVKE